MNKYRIKAVQPDKYIVERKGWFFWRACLGEQMGGGECGVWIRPLFFSTATEARNAWEKAREDQDKIRAHCAQKPIYFD